MSERVILGIDPGTNVMGYGVIRVAGQAVSMVAMGVIDLRKMHDPYLRLGHIFERVTGIIESYLPDEMAIEAPFFGKNVQSMLKLGRAQGVAIAAAIHRDIPIHEYAPLKIKMAITGNPSPATAVPRSSRWPACCATCYIWMPTRPPTFLTPPTPSVPPTVTTCRAAVRSRRPVSRVGKTL